MTRLYLVRHGETEMNEKGCYCGWMDCELSRKGIHQGMLLHHSFEDINLDVIFSSDLKRAVDTANIISIGKDVQLNIDSRLKELNFGVWEGKHYTEIMKEHPESWENWTRDWQNAAPAEGESFSEMWLRVSDFIKAMMHSYKNKDILIVAHQGVLRIITTYLLDIPVEKTWSFHFEQGAYSILELLDNHCTIKSINKI